MVDRHVGHGHIEVLFLFVESYFNSAEVDLQSGDVLFLFHDDLLLLSTESGLFFFELDLGLTSFLLTFAVLLFFIVILDLLLFNRDRLRHGVPVNKRDFARRDILLLFKAGIILRDILLSNQKFHIFIFTVG
jgi:hypothetical protein